MGKLGPDSEPGSLPTGRWSQLRWHLSFLRRPGSNCRASSRTPSVCQSLYISQQCHLNLNRSRPGHWLWRNWGARLARPARPQAP